MFGQQGLYPAAIEEKPMTQNDRPQPLQRQGTSAWGRIPARRLAPICRDALTRHWKGRPPRRVWQLMRLIVFERDGWTCVYCLRFVPRKLAIVEIPGEEG